MFALIDACWSGVCVFIADVGESAKPKLSKKELKMLKKRVGD